jgi:hypothetical protein
MSQDDIRSILCQLKLAGWTWLPCSADVEPLAILEQLGPLLTIGPNGANYRDLKPYTKDAAPRGSMSSVTGTSAQPMHTDAAYIPLPPRYIALYCLEAGEAECPTHVWGLDLARLQHDRPNVLCQTTWVVQGGRNPPFYCSIADFQREQVRIRFDPLCMRPVSKQGDTVEKARDALLAYAERVDFQWERGALLIIDNWRTLHARGDGAERAPSRRVRRWSIGASSGLVF